MVSFFVLITRWCINPCIVKWRRTICNSLPFSSLLFWKHYQTRYYLPSDTPFLAVSCRSLLYFDYIFGRILISRCFASMKFYLLCKVFLFSITLFALCFVFSIVTDAFSFFQSNLCFQELFVLLYYMSVRKIFPHKWINVLCHYCSKKPLQHSPDNCIARGFIFIQKQLLL